jgi:hypothetical protein
VVQFRGGRKLFGGELIYTGYFDKGWMGSTTLSGSLFAAISDSIEAGLLHVSLKVVRLADNAEIKVSGMPSVHPDFGMFRTQYTGLSSVCLQTAYDPSLPEYKDSPPAPDPATDSAPPVLSRKKTRAPGELWCKRLNSSSHAAT